MTENTDKIAQEFFKKLFSKDSAEEFDTIPIDNIQLEKLAQSLKEDISARQILKNFYLLNQFINKNPDCNFTYNSLKYRLLEDEIENNDDFVNLFDLKKIDAVIDLILSFDSLELLVLSERFSKKVYKEDLPVRFVFAGEQNNYIIGSDIFNKSNSEEFKTFIGKYSNYFNHNDDVYIHKFNNLQEEYTLKYIEHFLNIYLKVFNNDHQYLNGFLKKYCSIFSKSHNKILFIPVISNLNKLNKNFFNQNLTQYIAINLAESSIIGSLLLWKYKDHIRNSFIPTSWLNIYDKDMLNRTPDFINSKTSNIYQRINTELVAFEAQPESVDNLISTLLDLNKNLLEILKARLNTLKNVKRLKCDCDKFFPSWNMGQNKCFLCQRVTGNKDKDFNKLRGNNSFYKWILSE